ncbi:MAG: Trm112 family protein [Chthoniobacteraceae bacterium]
MINPDLLPLLRCPLSMQPLRLASAELLARLPQPLEAALVREDGAVVYPIRDGIPVLLPEEAINVV